MKRIFSLLASFAMVMIAIAKDMPQSIVLSTKNGNDVKELKFFRSDEIKEAINEALPHDTIYFTSGRFDLGNMEFLEGADSYYDRMLSKPLTFIGAGAEGDDATVITSNEYRRFWLNIDDSFEVDRNISFEGMVIDMHLSVRNNVDNLTFRNASLSYGFSDVGESDGSIDKLVIDRCEVGDLRPINGHASAISINNSKISYIEGDFTEAENAKLDHCYVSHVYPFKGIIKYSTIEHVYDSADTKFMSCVLFSKDSYAYYDENCVETDGRDAEYIDESPAEYGFGDCGDSTPIGTSGGKTPFTLNPSYPTPDSSGGVDNMISLALPAKDKIKINVTLKGNK